jgi:molybdopterin molybdotransferase
LAATAGSGATVTPLGIAPDRPAALRERLAGALDHDVLLVTGGVSRGEFDFVEGALADLGFRQLFDAVAVQPG